MFEEAGTVPVCFRRRSIQKSLKHGGQRIGFIINPPVKPVSFHFQPYHKTHLVSLPKPSFMKHERTGMHTKGKIGQPAEIRLDLRSGLR
jgi:hypothetical protein